MEQCKYACSEFCLVESQQQTISRLESDNAKLREELARLKAPMEPVGEVFNPIPSPAISSSALIYYPQKLPHGAQLYAAPPAFLIAEVEARGRKEACIVVGDYTIFPFEDRFWINHSSGEGMAVGKGKLEQLIKDFYAVEF